MSDSPRRLARYITMLVDGYGFALPANAQALAKREAVRQALADVAASVTRGTFASSSTTVFAGGSRL